MILALVIAGFALLGAGTYRQSGQLFGRRPPIRIRLALLCAGYGVLALSFSLVVAGGDVGRQIVQWFGLLTVGALVMLVGFWIRGARQERTGTILHASEKPNGVLVRR